MSGPAVKFGLDHPQKPLTIFQVNGRAGRFGLVKKSHLPTYSPICLFSGDNFKIFINSTKKELETFLYSAVFRGVLWTPSYTNSALWGKKSFVFLWRNIYPKGISNPLNHILFPFLEPFPK